MTSNVSLYAREQSVVALEENRIDYLTKAFSFESVLEAHRRLSKSSIIMNNFEKLPLIVRLEMVELIMQCAPLQVLELQTELIIEYQDSNICQEIRWREFLVLETYTLPSKASDVSSDNTPLITFLPPWSQRVMFFGRSDRQRVWHQRGQAGIRYCHRNCTHPNRALDDWDNRTLALVTAVYGPHTVSKVIDRLRNFEVPDDQIAQSVHNYLGGWTKREDDPFPLEWELALTSSADFETFEV